MGYSTTSKAADTLDSLMNILQEGQDRETSNTWTVKHQGFDRTYFYEVDRKDEPDGGIRGDVQENTIGDNCRYAGRFHITGEGVIRHFPGATAKQHRAAEAAVSSRTYRDSGIGRI